MKEGKKKRTNERKKEGKKDRKKEGTNEGMKEGRKEGREGKGREGRKEGRKEGKEGREGEGQGRAGKGREGKERRKTLQICKQHSFWPHKRKKLFVSQVASKVKPYQSSSSTASGSWWMAKLGTSQAWIWEVTIPGKFWDTSGQKSGVLGAKWGTTDGLQRVCVQKTDSSGSTFLMPPF